MSNDVNNRSDSVVVSRYRVSTSHIPMNLMILAEQSMDFTMYLMARCLTIYLGGRSLAFDRERQHTISCVYKAVIRRYLEMCCLKFSN